MPYFLYCTCMSSICQGICERVQKDVISYKIRLKIKRIFSFFKFSLFFTIFPNICISLKNSSTRKTSPEVVIWPYRRVGKQYSKNALQSKALCQIRRVT